jgi:hypothetical protein
MCYFCDNKPESAEWGQSTQDDVRHGKRYEDTFATFVEHTPSAEDALDADIMEDATSECAKALSLAGFGPNAQYQDGECDEEHMELHGDGAKWYRQFHKAQIAEIADAFYLNGEVNPNWPDAVRPLVDQ